jgi:ligand-binding sensor domain-containing protein
MRRFLLILILLNGGMFFSFAQSSNWKFFCKENSGLPTNRIRTVLEDRKGNYWIATWDDGLVKYDGKTWKTFNVVNSKLPNNSIYCMRFDNKGHLWIGTFGGGVAEFDCNSKWKIYNTKNSGLPNDWIYSIAFDKTWNVWIGTYTEGLAVFNHKNWKVYNKTNSKLPNNKITAIYVYDNDDKIIGTADHMIFIQNGVWKTEEEMNIISNEDAVYWISPFGKDSVLMCYKFGSIVIYDGKEFQFFNDTNSNLTFRGFYSVTADKKKTIWAGSFILGVVHKERKNWILFNKTNSELKDNMIFSIYADTKNNKWFSTYNQGISIYNEDGVKL